MAQFKLELLTQVVEQDNLYYLASTITEFESQVQKHNFNQTHAWSQQHLGYDYTLNEKLSIHANAQKDLSFSMYKNIYIGDQMSENPYVFNIHIGSQILLTDKVGHCHLFTVTSISWDFKNTNILYNYKCQDSFTYQLIRQNDGYTIKNDPATAEFIGAKNIDWWVINHIVPECYIPYSYIPLNTGLYLSKKDKDKNPLKFFKTKIIDQTQNNNLFTNVNLDNETLTDVDEIIKEAYTSEDFFEAIPFSCSGSNGSAALISLGEKLGLIIQTFERPYYFTDPDTNRTYLGLSRYFWFEPAKKPNYTGLTYSPNIDVSSFKLSSKGDSLTTVLNVFGPTRNDENITLLPAVTPFFANWFASDEWTRTEYYAGMFSQVIEGQDLQAHWNEIADFDCGAAHWLTFTEDTDKSTFIAPRPSWLAANKILWGTVLTQFPISSTYNRLSFRWPKESSWLDEWSSDTMTFSLIIEYYQQRNIVDAADSNKVVSIWETKLIQIQEDEEIPSFLLGKAHTLSHQPDYNHIIRTVAIAAIAQPSRKEKTSNNVHLFCHWYRDFTEDDKEFAEIADQCPWLENKLIDFSYFVKHNIISPHEYKILMNRLTNDLRIANGQLLFYSQAYYTAIHQKTQILSSLINKVDMLGASCQADILTPYQDFGKADDITSFRSAYQSLFQTDNSLPVLLMDYYETLSDYFNKGWQAEQRFLKNIKDFETYFNATNSFASGEDSYIAEDTVYINPQIDLTQPDIYYISFEGSEFRNIFADTTLKADVVTAQNEQISPIYETVDDNYVLASFVTEKNITSFYKPTEHTGDIIELHKDVVENVDEDLDLYNYKREYFLEKDIYEQIFPKLEQNNPRIQSILNDHGEVQKTVVLLKRKELARLYLLRHPNEFLQHEIDRYIPLDWIRYGTYDQNGWYAPTWEHYSQSSIPLFDSVNLNSFKFEVFGATYWKWNTQTWQWEVIPDKAGPYIWADYKSNFPLSNIYYYGPKYFVSRTNKDTDPASSKYGTPAYTITRVNEKGQDEKEYQAAKDQQNKNMKDVLAPSKYYEFQIMPFVSGLPSGAEDLDGIDLDDYIASTATAKDNFKFYAFCQNPDTLNTSMWLGITSLLLATVAGGMFALLAPVLTAAALPTAIAALGVYASSFQESDCKWITKYEPKRFFTPTIEQEGNDDEIWTHPFVNDKDRGSFWSCGTANWDSNKALFAKTANSAELCESYTRSQPNKKIGGAYRWEYYNYYGLLAPTYSFEVHPPFDDSGHFMKAFDEKGQPAWHYDGPNSVVNYHLWVKNQSYYRILTKDELLSRTGKYHLLLLYNCPSWTGNIHNTMDVYNSHKKWNIFTKGGAENDPDMTLLPPAFNPWGDQTSLRFNASTFYFLRKESLIELPFDSIPDSFWNEDGTLPLTEFARMNGWSELSTDTSEPEKYANCIFYRGGPLPQSFWQSLWGTQSSLLMVFMVVEDEPYETAIINNQPTTYTNWDDFHINAFEADIYNLFTCSTHQSIDLFKTTDFMTNGQVNLPDKGIINITFYTRRLIANDNKVLCTKEDWTPYQQEVGWFYKKYDTGYKRCYTFTQLRNSQKKDEAGNIIFPIDGLSNSKEIKYVYLDSFSRSQTNFSRYHNTFDFPVYLHHLQCQNEKIIQHDSVQLPGPLHIDFQNNSAIIVKKEYQNHLYSSLFTLARDPEPIKLSRMSNGTFWYFFHDKIQWPVIMEICATIETQLTQSWMQALSASKYCQYFLPDSWTLKSETTTNFFAKDILVPIYETVASKARKMIGVELSRKYIPQVTTYYDYDDHGHWTNWLPSYHFVYFNNIKNLNNQNSDNTAEVNSNDELTMFDTMRNNPAFKNIVTAFKGDHDSTEKFMRSWAATPQGYRTYYYSVRGGTLWKDIVGHITQTANVFSDYSGIYLMLYRLLRQQYKPRQTTEYDTALQKSLSTWTSIYQQFPSILLETKYTNNDAFNSRELLKMAKLALKQKTQVEYNYSISVLDIHSLRGYKNQFLHIGDAIALEVGDYYDRTDDIFTALSQYLFISDLSYNLRQDTDISITVNTIKYEDKLLQQLVKLIR